MRKSLARLSQTILPNTDSIDVSGHEKSPPDLSAGVSHHD
jgi:hypothetical protein